MIAGVDIGCGYAKAGFSGVADEAECIRLDTKPYRQLVGEHVSDGREMALVIGEGDRFVGELALLQSVCNRSFWTTAGLKSLRPGCPFLLRPVSWLMPVREQSRFRIVNKFPTISA